ncbi:hypothetical protein MW887_011573 [Aspergillus wentii]|nr:hypothetical protein MW887_011573 [Aspergillus wentii]
MSGLMDLTCNDLTFPVDIRLLSVSTATIQMEVCIQLKKELAGSEYSIPSNSINDGSIKTTKSTPGSEVSKSRPSPLSINPPTESPSQPVNEGNEADSGISDPEKTGSWGLETRPAEVIDGISRSLGRHEDMSIGLDGDEVDLDNLRHRLRQVRGGRPGMAQFGDFIRQHLVFCCGPFARITYHAYEMAVQSHLMLK